MKINEPGTGRPLVAIYEDGTAKIYDKDATSRCLDELRPVVMMAIRQMGNQSRQQTKIVEQEIPNNVFTQLKRALDEQTKRADKLENELADASNKLMALEPPF